MPEFSHDNLFTVNVALEAKGKRLDAFLAENTPGFSREKVKESIKKGMVSINGNVCTSPRFSLLPGMVIEASIPQLGASLSIEEGIVDVLYEDEQLAVINKPAGLTVHPCPSCPEGTLANRLAARFPSLVQQDGLRPGIVHRLDKDTSGLLLVALTEQSRLELSTMFAKRHVHKEYLALVHGVPTKQEGRIEEPIGRDPKSKVKMAVVAGGKPAISDWRVLYADPSNKFSLVAVKILTGRTHQIRVHMAYLGHPLWGDITYGIKSGIDPAKRQMLHAWKLSFSHPYPQVMAAPSCKAGQSRDGAVLQFCCEPPEDFYTTLKGLCCTMLRVVITGMPGCGKSALLAAIKSAGIPVFSADEEVKKLYARGGDGWYLLSSRYGSRFMKDNGELDTIALFNQMKESSAFRRDLEGMIHPLVFQAQDAFWKKSEEEGHSIAVAEIPLYFETRFTNEQQGNKPPVVIGVHCPQDQRFSRLKSIRNWPDETIAVMESWQWPEEKKMAACDMIVVNDSTLEALTTKAQELVGKLSSMQKEETQNAVSLVAMKWQTSANESTLKKS